MREGEITIVKTNKTSLNGIMRLMKQFRFEALLES